MKVPLSWLRAYAPVPEQATPADIARRLTAAGLEVETHEPVGGIDGLVVAQVVTVEELTSFKKPIRYCRVATSADDLAADPQALRGVICGARNFAPGDRVVLALPGTVLPGGFEIAARRTYDHMSEGMLCAADELAVGEDHSGIIVLPPGAPLGADFGAYAGLRDHVFDIAITPDRGYAVSIRGIARELASAYQVPFTDPVPAGAPEAGTAGGYPASIADPAACDRIAFREVSGFDPAAPTPVWMWLRLARCGVRSVSLAVDVTNYLMLELGQPLHAFDRGKLAGPIVVRRAAAGERLETLDHVTRALDPRDILITDGSGPISLAGTMGGLATEIDERTADIVIEGAHFSATGVAAMARRHKLHSEASYRFERGTDPELPGPATGRAAQLLAELGGGTVAAGLTYARADAAPVTITMAADYPDRVAGVPYGLDTVARRLAEVGCTVAEAHAPAEPTIAPWRAPPARPGATAQATAPVAPHHGKHDREVPVLRVTPPSWRPDLTDPADLAEEVIRLEGYEAIPAAMPRALAGRGLSPRQRLARSVARTLAEAGLVELHTDPFAPGKDADSLSLPPHDERRPAVRIANPLSEDEPFLRTTLLPGLLRALARNTGRGFTDVALYEAGLVFRPRPGAPATAPILATDRGPDTGELSRLEAALPDQPAHIGAVWAGQRELPGWWGPGRAADWADAIEAARAVAATAHLTLEVRAAAEAPWHPGRCAALYVRAVTAPKHAAPGSEQHEWLVGHAGELHPRVVAAFGVPARTCAFELDFTTLAVAAEASPKAAAPPLSAYPLATQDVALVVAAAVPAAAVEEALAAGAGGLLEDVRLFDVYTGAQLAAGEKSLAYTLRFRAPDRTLTVAETTAARDAAVAEASHRVGAVQRA
ncbi:MAG TPA: phenylalanine--tRNA ligase subunit beta [Trebonia sp.]|jgi:phenylalanyl-tRNA synthetase beta chain|nr:phenylalanine--tRNA ligase subunit beta [Trebonia sp.]